VKIDYTGPTLYRAHCSDASELTEWWAHSRVLLITGENPDAIATIAVREAARSTSQYTGVRLPRVLAVSESDLPWSLETATAYAFLHIGLCPTHPDLLRSYTRLLGTALDTGQPVVLASLLSDTSYPQRLGVPLVRRLNPHMRLRFPGTNITQEEI